MATRVINQSLAELANACSSLIAAHSWHTQSEFDAVAPHAKKLLFNPQGLLAVCRRLRARIGE